MNADKKLTMKSRIGELYENPVGHDAIAKVLLQLGISEKWITNPIVSGCRLDMLAGLTRAKLKPAFFEMLLRLVNSEPDVPFVQRGNITEKWWKEAVFYQIYPRSFCDTNGDGIGDLRGILEKLDYLQELGVDALWLSPIYDSPNDDNGYDIRDYRKIMKEFGTMEDFDELLAEVHKRGMRLIMDLVVNHTSDEHEWFRRAVEDPESEYHDYYFFRKSDDVPNNWTSFFAGPAWNYYEKNKEWALHLFSKKQMDLNWDNEAVRREAAALVNWWLDKGVDGFRMDVINYISKEEGLPDGDETIGALMGYPGIERYYYGPNLHKYLHELRMAAFEPHEAFSVGETPGVGLKMAQLLTAEERKEIDMVFSFDHLETPGHVRFDEYQYDLNYYRDYIVDWMEHYGDNCWMSLFYNNHDNPRMADKVNADPKYVRRVQALLAVMQFTLKGTPFVFQGDEMGLTNYRFSDIDQITDVEAKGYYQEYLDQGMTPDEAFQKIVSGTREHTRILLPWNTSFPECHAGLNQDMNEKIRRIYRNLIVLRRRERALIYGTFQLLCRKKDRFVYKRESEEASLIIECNLGQKKQKAYRVPEGYRIVFSVGAERADDSAAKELEPYGALIWKKKKQNKETTE